MPEVRFRVRWPDGAEVTCYSPSSVVREVITAGRSYPLTEFVARCREALTRASARVEAKYGVPCTRAAAQLAEIEALGGRYAADAPVTVTAFLDDRTHA